MVDIIRKFKADMILSAIVCTVMGIVLLVWPERTIDIFCKVLAVGLVVIGGMNLFSYFTNKMLHPFSGVLGTIVVLVGIWIFIRPSSIVSLVPIVIGVMLCVHGVQDTRLAFESKANGYEKWWSMLVIALISIIFGLLCIINAFGVVALALQFIGIALIYDGVTDLWVASQAVRSANEKKKMDEVLEASYKEVDDSET